jgi:hypothetical protein
VDILVYTPEEFERLCRERSINHLWWSSGLALQARERSWERFELRLLDTERAEVFLDAMLAAQRSGWRGTGEFSPFLKEKKP